MTQAPNQPAGLVPPAQARRLVGTYLQRLAGGDLAGVLALFSENARVSSPLYGEMPAAEFYRVLFRDTRTSVTTLIDVFTAADSRRLAALFRYDWTLAGGIPVQFTCVDVMDLDQDGKIGALSIIYDPAHLRDTWTTASRLAAAG